MHKPPNYFYYYVLPSDVELKNPKIIFLWTAYFGDYKKHWSWAIGPDPVINDCNNINIDAKCLITNHIDLLQKADVILFSLEDLKQVRYSNNFMLHIISRLLW